MNFDKPITRRESIRKLLKLSGSLAFAGAATWPIQKPSPAKAASENKKFTDNTPRFWESWMECC